jgi:hypothetical protein
LQLVLGMEMNVTTRAVVLRSRLAELLTVRSRLRPGSVAAARCLAMGVDLVAVLTVVTLLAGQSARCEPKCAPTGCRTAGAR